MTEQENQTFVQKVAQLKKSKKGHIRYIMEELACTKEQAIRIFKEIQAGGYVGCDIEDIVIPEEPIEPQETTMEKTVFPVRKEGGIIDFGTFCYNEVTKTYIVPLKSYGNNYLCPEEQHNAMMAAYSGWKGGEQSIDELARLYNMPRECVKEYKEIMKWTHDMLPISEVDVYFNRTEEAIQRALNLRKLQAQHDLQKRDWMETQQDAMSWRKFKAAQIDPFAQFVATYKPEPIKTLDLGCKNTKLSEVFVVGLSDLHFGAKASAEELYNGADFNAQVITDIIDQYAIKIGNDVRNRTYKFKKCVVCALGDILHSLTGMTEKGTVLDMFDVKREAQFRLAETALRQFLTRMIEIFGKVDVFVVKGNHAGWADWALFRVVEGYFKDNPAVSFTSTSARQLRIRLGDVAIVMEHGDSDNYKSPVPVGGTPREAYGLTLFEHPEVRDAKYKIMIQGDKHHFEHHEFRTFEFVMFSSPVTGDRYADHTNLHSRPRQNCMIIDEYEGIKEVRHYYFD